MSKKERIIKNLIGASGNQIVPIFTSNVEEQKGPILILTTSDFRANKLKVDLSFFSCKKVYVFPEEKDLFLEYEAKDHNDTDEMIKVLNAIIKREDCYIIATPRSAMQSLPPVEIIKENKIELSLEQNFKIEDIQKKLIELGYVRKSMIAEKGEFSIRGSIVDIFSVHSDEPYRIEFFDDEVESIRSFDVETQRTAEVYKNIEVTIAEMLPMSEDLFKLAHINIEKRYDLYAKKLLDEASKEKIDNRKNILLEYIETKSNIELIKKYMSYFYKDNFSIIDYFNERDTVLVDEADKFFENAKEIEKLSKYDFEVLKNEFKVIKEDEKNLVYKVKNLYSKLEEKELNIYTSTSFKKEIRGFGKENNFESENIFAREILLKQGDLKDLVNVLSEFDSKNYEINIISNSDDRIYSLEEYIAINNVKGNIHFSKGEITESIDLEKEKKCFIWEGDIFKNIKKRVKGKSKKSNKKNLFSDLKKGDFVIHENHGVGKFICIKKMEIQGITRDYLQIKYAGQDVLYVPVEQMDLIQKYVGTDGISPKLNKMSSSEWKNVKKKAKVAIENMAKELLELSAIREKKGGFAFSKDSEWQKNFEETFPFEETEDQKRCIREIKEDMEKKEAMDRLLCGDVGYGKTEVAARAICKCLNDGKQSAVLVPTTILANQHYNTLKNRFENFPVKVDFISRFKTVKEINETLKKLEDGEIDLIIGTHRMLSDDVKFRDLGLLVIDEEQRFGVKHKEKIKKLKENIDVLTLSATPIPRTLHMSLIGIRNMSLIEEPPAERLPVQTYVFEKDDELIKKAIEKEIGRGGQVYVIYNRVRGINRIAKEIKALMPEIRVDVAHGQMNEKELEKIMFRFINHESDVMVATTILESGIDISNANTIIILDADKLGLSQLYQLRGRVGRSNRLAYAYLLFQKDKVLLEASEKRLKAIKEFTELGAGFKISMKDLEIRGAGNLLGSEQHGHMLAIGYELYCKLVENAVKSFSGEDIVAERQEVLLELDETAYIPDRYIDDEIIKLQIYKKISDVTKEDEEKLKQELKDRFGKIPKETLTLIQISIIRKLAEHLGIDRIRIIDRKVNVSFREDVVIKAEFYKKAVDTFGNRVLIQGGRKKAISLDFKGEDKILSVNKLLSVLN